MILYSNPQQLNYSQTLAETEITSSVSVAIEVVLILYFCQNTHYAPEVDSAMI